MNGRRLAMLSLLLSTAVLTVHAQSDFQVTVTVTNKHFIPPKPVTDARVWLTFQDGTEHVTDDRQPTNQAGQARLRVSPAAMERPLRVEITDAPGLMIYTPPDGVLGDKVSSTLPVVLLPKGSPAFMEPAQIEAMMNRLSGEMRKIQELKTELNQAKNEKPDFEVALEQWASDHGLVYAELDQKLRDWAQDIATHEEGKSDVLKAEAELALRQYEKARELFQRAAGKSRSALQRDLEKKEQVLKETRQDLYDDVQRTVQSTNSSRSAGQYAEATSDAEAARKDAEAVHQQYPDDAEIRRSWARASLLGFYCEWGQARWLLTHAGHVEESVRLLTEVVGQSKQMLTLLSPQQDPDYRAYMSVVVVVGSIYLSEVSDNQTAAGWRNAAVESAKEALDESDKTKSPNIWVHMQLLYALTLAAKAARGFTDAKAPISQTMQGMDDAVTAFTATLDVFKATGRMQDWAEAKTHIADIQALEGQNPTIAREVRNELLNKAEAAYQEALAQTDRSKDPESWSILQADIGEVDSHLAMIGDPSRAPETWARAVTAMRDAAKAKPKEEDPARWASIEGELALVLENEGDATPGAAGAGLLDEAAKTYAEEASVFSKESFPLRWARAKSSEADALRKEAEKLEPGNLELGKALELYSRVAASYEEALTVFTRETYPQRWAAAEIGLGRALADEATHLEAAKAIDLNARAAVADKAALEVFTRQTYPQGWAEGIWQMSSALAAEGMKMQGEAARAVLKESVAGYVALLEFYPTEPELLSKASDIDHEYLEDFDQAYVLNERLEEAQPNDGNKLNLAEAALTDGKFDKCVAALKTIDESKLDGKYAMVRQALLLSCAWGEGDHAAARQAADALSAAAPAAKAHGWTSSGDLMYLKDAKEFGRGRATWIRLFQAIQDGNSKTVADAAGELGKMAEK